jgi:hypothetical protein
VGLGVSIGSSVAVAVGDTVAVGDEVGSFVGLNATSFLQAPKTSRQANELNIKENPRLFMMIGSY